MDSLTIRRNGVTLPTPARLRHVASGTTDSMSLVVFLILLAVIGLVVGALARLLLPGPDPMGAFATIVLGLAGSFLAGLFSWYVLKRHGAGLILSVAFSMLLLWVRRRASAGSAPRRA